MALTIQEKKTLKSIIVYSENDPNKPEFPPGNPKFPATPTYRIEVPGYSNVWLKDESQNETGTHKDRMAWEMIVTYRDLLLAKKKGRIKKLPHMSIISSGSAAIAIQTQLKKYHLPNLKVLVDVDFRASQKKYLESLGCEIFETNLSLKPLNGNEILELTHNRTGIDITSEQALGPNTRFYDWLSYEIINSSPDYCFIPFGTGNLYENILNINKREVSTLSPDPRFHGDREKLSKCNFLGVTTNNPRSKAAEKLYSPHRPFVHFNEDWIRFFRHAGYCGELSDVYLIKEQYLDEALKLAKKLSIRCECSGIVGLGLLLQLHGKIEKDKKILIVNTGKSIGY